MKYDFIADTVTSTRNGDSCHVLGRVSSVRRHKNVVFLDVRDHTGMVQVVADRDSYGDGLEEIAKITPGSYIGVAGKMVKQKRTEVYSSSVDNIAPATLSLYPLPWEINGLDPVHGNQVFDHTGIYLANPQRAAVLGIMSNFIDSLHRYFRENGFTHVQPPIITDKILYRPDNVITANVHGEDVFLSQCATFELEPLALVFDKVYTISPAFRNEQGGSRRHLAEYTHAKAEVLLADIEDLMKLAGDSLYNAVKCTIEKSQKELELLGVEIEPEPIRPEKHVRMTYNEALKIAQAEGSTTQWGEGFSRRDEEILTKHVGDNYLWVQFPPFASEGFPYRRKSDDRTLSMTCDLIAPHGAGEMVGVAEKTTDAEELIQNLIDKGKKEYIHDYWDYILLRRYGLPPHGGMGAAPERIMFGLLDLDHVRLTRPWPRYPDRKIRNRRKLNTLGDREMEKLVEKYSLE